MQKRILFYCQHSMGIGHLVRSFALVNSLKKSFQVTLVSGGVFPEGMSIPKGINFIQLPAIGIDANNALTAIGSSESAFNIMRVRQKKMISVYNEILPDIFITEFFPFGKIQFLGELSPILKRIKSSDKSVQVVCSLRDILEPNYLANNMGQDLSVSLINEFYNSILVHGDPEFIRLEETCPQLSRIKVPVSYTGYVSDKKYLPKINRKHFNEIVLSAGGGKVAEPFISKMVRSFQKFGFGEDIVLRIVTGPIYPIDAYKILEKSIESDPNIILIRSVESLTKLWEQARLSISQGGYNTLMELICSRIPALILPHSNENNSEQEFRATRLQQEKLVKKLAYANTSEEEIALAVKNALNFTPANKEINLNGADNSRTILEKQYLEFSKDQS